MKEEVKEEAREYLEKAFQAEWSASTMPWHVLSLGESMATAVLSKKNEVKEVVGGWWWLDRSSVPLGNCWILDLSLTEVGNHWMVLSREDMWLAYIVSGGGN